MTWTACRPASTGAGAARAHRGSIRQVSVDIAHDLRTPLSRLGIRVEQLLATTSTIPNSASAWRPRQRLKQITSMFDSLLRRPDRAGAPQSAVPASGATEIGAALHEAYLPVARRMVSNWRYALPARPTALVDGDRDLLTQLFANLLENAIRHSPRGAIFLWRSAPGRAVAG